MNSSTCIQCETTKGGVSSGLATRQADRQLPLNLLSQHHSPLCRHSQPLRLNLSLLHLLLTRNDGNSPSCFVISSIPPNSPPNSSQKSIGKSSVPINLRVLKSSNATMDTLRSY